ncbi:hypothetical protein DID73_00920 [Candidatus Marinamargulisbacteria bacterium SCGC AG-343-K17]|nr:hypothetical protein DID73_00920 [Candidatus Marinamargulisbacteria bacterium SCGC AG-343-K17]
MTLLRPNIKETSLYYDDCASFIDDDAKAMGWSSQFNQMLRFDVMTYLVDMRNSSILDVGCGDGAFFHYLSDQNINAEYKGIDVSKKMVQRAQNRYPGINVRQIDFFDVQEPYDVVACSGALSMSADEPMQYLSSAIDHLFSISRSHLVFNLLSHHAPSKSSKFNRYYPQEVLNLCFSKTQYVTMHHGYLPNDFTIYMVKP